MLRFRLLVAAPLVLALSGATPVPVLAATVGPVAGQAFDAGGRPLAGIRIELVRAVESRPAGVPARAQRTDAQGAWSFGSVPAGEYVVRMSHHDRTTGVPVSVSDSTGARGVVIVAPSLPSLERFSQAQAAAGAAAAAGGGASTGAIVAGVLFSTAAAVAVTSIDVIVQRDES